MAAESMERWISNLYRNGQIYIARELEKVGVGSGQYGCISVICDHPGVSQDEIAKRLVLNKGTVARIVKQLEDTGFLQREASGKDKRTNAVYPSDKALAAQERIQEVAAEWENLVTQGMNGSERMLLRSMLKRANDSATLAVRPQYARKVRKSRFQLQTDEE